MNEKCDDKETVLSVINRLHQEFIATGIKDCVLLEGDQVTYSLIVSIKEEYGNDLKWLIPTPGHILKNFQEVLQKIYFDGGLIDLGKACGYLPNSIGVNFDRMHKFIIETWESLYRYFLTQFISSTSKYQGIQSDTTILLEQLPEVHDKQSYSRNLKQTLEDIIEQYPTFHEDFLSFMNVNALKVRHGNFGNSMFLKMGLPTCPYICQLGRVSGTCECVQSNPWLHYLQQWIEKVTKNLFQDTF